MGARDEMETQRVRAPKPEANLYSRPEDRKRVTGSANGIASRRNIQRATANPRAAQHTCMNFIETPKIQIDQRYRGRSAFPSIGTIVPGGKADKARPCHRSSTEVIRGSGLAEFRPYQKEPISVSFHAFRLHGPAGRGHHNRRKAAFGG